MDNLPSTIPEPTPLATFELKNHEIINLQLTSERWRNSIKEIENVAKRLVNQEDGTYEIFARGVFESENRPFAYYWRKLN